jgi:phenylacetic acid degradation operon negative regulatory protein
MVVFDVPQRRASERARLRRYLQDRGFGYLQNSLWVTPDPLQNERDLLAGESANVESLILLEARPCAGESDEDIVLGSWNFEAINERYAAHAEILNQRPRQRLDSPVAAKAFQRWLGCERLAWIEAMSLDPLLPESLHPTGYRGVRAFVRRLEVMTDVGEQLRKASISN